MHRLLRALASWLFKIGLNSEVAKTRSRDAEIFRASEEDLTRLAFNILLRITRIPPIYGLSMSSAQSVVKCLPGALAVLPAKFEVQGSMFGNRVFHSSDISIIFGLGMKLAYDQNVLSEFCRERGITKLELFGSALADRLLPDSDVDLLCTLRPDSRCTLLGWADMQFKLAEIFGRPVDLVSRWAIERSQNPYRRQAILSTARPIYVQG